jgi:hypothetical protein
MQNKVWGGKLQCLGGVPVKEIGCGMKSFYPISGRDTGLEHEGSHDVVGGMNYALGFAILLRSVWTRHAECNAVGKKESASSDVIKFSTIVTLHTFDSGGELLLHKGKKLDKVGKVADLRRRGKV